MNILITGGAGMIGSVLARYFNNKKNKVFCLDNLSGGTIENVPEGCRFLGYDLVKPDKEGWLTSFLKSSNVKYVIHCAAYAAEGLSPFIREYNYLNNIVGSMRIINCSVEAGVEKFINFSSMAVYGHAKPPFKEEMDLIPADPYGLAKLTVEHDLELARKQFGLNYSTIRPHNCLSIYQNFNDPYRNCIAIWIRQAILGLPITIYGDGQQVRAFSDAEYLCAPIEKLLENLDEFSGETFNIGADKEISIIDAACVVQKVAMQFGYKTEIKHLEERDEVKFAYSDHSKAKNWLGFRDFTNFEEMVKKMFDFAVSSGRVTAHQKRMDYEINKGMYKFWK
jgi:UDP-glucose 4-epimerase